MKINNLLLGIIALFSINNAIASSTTFQPFEHFNNTQVTPYSAKNVVLHPGLNNWSVQGGAFKQTANAFSLNNAFGYNDAQKISKAITGTAPIAQSLGKKALIGAISGGVIGIGSAFLISAGLDYVQGQWAQSNPAAPTTTIPATYSLAWSAQYASATTATEACNLRPYNSCFVSGQWTADTSNKCMGVLTCSALGPIGSLYWDGRTAINNPQPGGTYSCPSGYSLSGTDCIPLAQVTTPITQQQAETIAEASPITPTDNDYQMMLEAGWAIPIEGTQTVTIDTTSLTPAEQTYLTNAGYYQPTTNTLAGKAGSIYKDPVTGEYKQPMVQLAPGLNGSVSMSTYNNTVTNTGTVINSQNGTPIAEETEVDPCSLNPDRAGCSSLGTPDETNPISTPKTISGDFNSFNISGQCPSDKTFSVAGMTHTIEMSPICGAAQNYIKPFLLLMASVTAYFIFVGGLRT